jgi:hypothetical protein
MTGMGQIRSIAATCADGKGAPLPAIGTDARHYLTEDNRLTAFSDREVIFFWFSGAIIPVTSSTKGETNEHVPEGKQGVPVFRIGFRARCNDRLEFAE